MRFKIEALGEIEAESLDDCLIELSDRIWALYQDGLDSGTILDSGSLSIQPMDAETVAAGYEEPFKGEDDDED